MIDVPGLEAKEQDLLLESLPYKDKLVFPGVLFQERMLSPTDKRIQKLASLTMTCPTFLVT